MAFPRIFRISWQLRICREYRTARKHWITWQSFLASFVSAVVQSTAAAGATAAGGRPSTRGTEEGTGGEGKEEEKKGQPGPFSGKSPGAIVHFSTFCTARPPKRIAARAASH